MLQPVTNGNPTRLRFRELALEVNRNGGVGATGQIMDTYAAELLVHDCSGSGRSILDVESGVVDAAGDLFGFRIIGVEARRSVAIREEENSVGHPHRRHVR